MYQKADFENIFVDLCIILLAATKYKKFSRMCDIGVSVMRFKFRPSLTFLLVSLSVFHVLSAGNDDQVISVRVDSSDEAGWFSPLSWLKKASDVLLSGIKSDLLGTVDKSNDNRGHMHGGRQDLNLKKRSTEEERENAERVAMELERERIETERRRKESRIQMERERNALLGQAEVFAAFLGNSAGEGGLNFNSMSAAQQNIILDAAISLVNRLRDDVSGAKGFEERLNRVIGSFGESISKLSFATDMFINKHLEVQQNPDSISDMSKNTKQDKSDQMSKLLKILDTLKKSNRAIPYLFGIFMRYYDNKGSEIDWHPWFDYGSQKGSLVPLSGTGGISSDGLLLLASLCNERGFMYVIFESMHLRDSLESNTKRVNYHDLHILELRSLYDIAASGMIQGLQSGHSILVLIKSMKDYLYNTLKFSGTTVAVLCGKDSVTQKRITWLLEDLLTGVYVCQSSSAKRLLEVVSQEIKNAILKALRENLSDPLWDKLSLQMCASDECKHIAYLMLTEEKDKLDHSSFFESNKYVLELIAANGKDAKEYSGLLIDDVLERGDNASILHMLALLDHEKHSDVFDKFNALYTSSSDKFAIDKFIADIKCNRDKYFPKDKEIVFKFDRSVSDELELANTKYKHEDLEMVRHISEACVNAKRKSSGPDKKE